MAQDAGRAAGSDGHPGRLSHHGRVSRRIQIGEISGVHGVKGWLKVYSCTEPRENVLRYSPWQLDHGGEVRKLKLLEGRRQGKTVVVRLEGITTREQAEVLRGTKISIDRSQLLPLPEGEYYWADLIGLEVIDSGSHPLGRVTGMMETGANDVMIVRGGDRREILIPWLKERVILEVDPDAGLIRVDWDPDY